MALPVVLGSSSVFRQRQLAVLGLDFAVGKPVFDESPLAGESARDTACVWRWARRARWRGGFLRI